MKPRTNAVCLTWRAHVKAVHGQPCCRLQANVAAANNHCLRRPALEGHPPPEDTWMAGAHANSHRDIDDYLPASHQAKGTHCIMSTRVYPAAPLLGLRQRRNDAVRVYHVAQVVDALQVCARRLEVRQADGLPMPHTTCQQHAHTLMGPQDC